MINKSTIKEKANNLKKDIPAIFIAMKKRETPLIAKIIAIITITYALSPIDLIPDFIPILGYLDDIIILPILIALVVKLIPENLLVDCRNEAEGMWSNGKPKKWYYALPIIIIWILVIWIILKSFIFS